jgi:hypothetical protein
MTARAPQRVETATTIIRDARTEYRSRHGLIKKSLSKQQRHEIGKAKISYVMGNLNEEDLRRTVEHALTPAALVPPPAMPAAVLVVHDEQNTRELAVGALRAAFLEAAGFADPMAALDAIEANSSVRVLVTRVMFGRPGKLNGIALARMVQLKRPGIKVVFVALAEYSCGRHRRLPADAA